MKSKNQKRDQAAEIVAAWRALSPTEQLASLDRRLGQGIGAKRQRAKLDGILHPVVPVTPVVAVAAPGEPAVIVVKKKFKKGNKQ